MPRMDISEKNFVQTIELVSIGETPQQLGGREMGTGWSCQTFTDTFKPISTLLQTPPDLHR